MTNLSLVGSATGETVGDNSTIPSATGSQGLSSSSGSYVGDYFPGYPNSYPWSNTYHCSKCGVWYTGYHCCSPVVVYPTVVSYPVYVQSPTDLTPLLEKLDELNEEIKKLRKQNKKAIDKA